jgi:hypothetical protein
METALLAETPFFLVGTFNLCLLRVKPPDYPHVIR